MVMEVAMAMKVLLSLSCVGACCLALYLYYTVWVVPQRLLAGFRRQGIGGPRPSFPYGNLGDMREAVAAAKSARRGGGRRGGIVHDYRPAVLPFYEKWRKEHGLNMQAEGDVLRRGADAIQGVVLEMIQSGSTSRSVREDIRRIGDAGEVDDNSDVDGTQG